MALPPSRGFQGRSSDSTLTVAFPIAPAVADRSIQYRPYALLHQATHTAAVLQAATSQHEHTFCAFCVFLPESSCMMLVLVA